MSFVKALIYIIFIIFVPISYAVEPAKPLEMLTLPKPLEPLSTELELGVFATSGNTNSKAAKGKVLVKQEFKEWKNEYLLDMFYTKNEYEGETEVTAQKLFLSTQSNYKLSKENTSVFVFGSYTDDKLSGYDYQSTIAIGYSARLFSNATSSLNYSVGPGYSFTRANDGEKTSSNIVRVEGKFQYNLSFTSKFTQNLSTEIALNRGQNTESKSESAISAVLRQNLKMKAAYSVIHNTDPLDSNEKVDTVTSLTLAYSF